MFWFGIKKRVNELEERTKKSFSDVKGDMDKIGKWIKHLDMKDKQLFDILNSLKEDLSSLREEVESLHEGLDLVSDEVSNRQGFKKLPVLGKQTGVEGVQKAVQTAVQTANFYDNFKGLSGNERLVIQALMNTDMKLSYEDLALLLGKERSTIRGQINSIKQKSRELELIKEITEKNGKKRVFVPEEIKEKIGKYAKVRVKNREKW